MPRHSTRAIRALRESPEHRALLVAFGAALRTARERAGLTQEQAAEAIDLSARQVQRIEAGRVDLSLVMLRRFCVAYALDVRALLVSAAS